MREEVIKLYKFDELTDEAKEKAREWWREASCGDNDFYEFIFEDASKMAAFMGIDMNTKAVKLMGGGTRYDPSIYFSGFWSQGDGACFEGTWRASSMKPLKELTGEAPKDKELHRIHRELRAIARKHPEASATSKHRGHYSHSGCAEIDADFGEHDYNQDDYEAIKQAMRDLMDWIYNQLEREYEWQNADAQVDESIRCNEYEFLETGERA